VPKKQLVLLQLEFTGICYQCRYGECDHCLNFNTCKCKHWWGRLAEIEEKKAELLRHPSACLWKNGTRPDELDMSIARHPSSYDSHKPGA
jgi:hypothetical protein